MYNNYTGNTNEDTLELSTIQMNNKDKVTDQNSYVKGINPILHPKDKLDETIKLGRLSKLTRDTEKFNINSYGKRPNIITDIKSARIANKVKKYQRKYGEDSLNPMIKRDSISLFSCTEVNLLEVN